MLIARGIGVNLCLVNQGSQVWFPASPSLSDETLSRCPVFWDALKPEPLPVEPSGVPGQRTTKSINPPGQYWYSQGTRPQTTTLIAHTVRMKKSRGQGALTRPLIQATQRNLNFFLAVSPYPFTLVIHAVCLLVLIFYVPVNIFFQS